MGARKLLTLLVVSVFLISLASTAVSAQEKLAEDQILDIAFDSGDLLHLDPHFSTTTVDRFTVNMIFSGLVKYPPGDQVSFEPDLAKSWESSEDKKVWTFHLREGVYFHPFPDYPDGYELTADDVVYSYHKAATAATSAFAGGYTGITVEKVDDYTVQFTLDEPVSEILFLAKVANNQGGFIVPKKALEEKGSKWFKTHPVGTGPFMFDSYKTKQSTTLVRNSEYYAGTPILEEVVIHYMPDVSPREAGLRTGELDIIEGLKEKEWAENIEKYPNVEASTFGPAETQVLHFNMTESPFDNIKVRKAVAYAINREHVAQFLGLGVPIYSPAMAPPSPGALTKEKAEEAGVAYEFNPDKAKELLEEAGYPDGIKTEVIVSEMASSYLKPMQIIQSQLRAVGIDLKLKVVEHSTFHSLIRDDASPLAYYACWRPNADVFLTRFYHSTSEVVEGESPDTNFSHYGAVDANSDGETDSIDALIEEAHLTLDSNEQIKLWEDAQIQLLEDMAALPIIRLEYTFPMKTYVNLGHPLEFEWTCYSPEVTENTKILAH